jgi:hypothetical protein
MIQPVSRIPRSRKPLSIRDFLGMDITGTRDVRRSPDMMNCILDDEGTPEMRTGYEKLFTESLGEGPILGIHRYDDTTRLIHHSTKLYTCTGVDAPAFLYDGLSGLRHSISFILGDKLCIIDGTKFLVYNGTAVTEATANAYVPLFLQGTPPGGGGTRIEDLNLLNPKWRQKFSTVSGTTTYQLHRTVSEDGVPQPLDAVEWVKLNGVTLTVTTNYTVDLSTGVLTLVSNPGVGTNNLEVQVYDADATDASRILKCTTAAVFGGPSDSKIFLTGNPDYPHIDWWTGITLIGDYDPTYWPDTNFDRVGGDNEAIVGYSIQYDRMIVHKADRSLYLRSWELTEDAYGRTVMRFPAVPMGKGIGTYDADSIAIIENNPVFLSSQGGVYRIVGTNVRDERNVEPISTLVDIPATGHGASIDFNNRYYLAVDGDIVWVCDYRRLAYDEGTRTYQPVWYPWNNMPVNVWCTDGETLLFGSKNEGMVYRMKTKEDLYPYNDNGQPIPTHYTTIFTTFDRDDMTKLVQNIIISQKMWSRAEINVEVATEEGTAGVIHTERMVLFDYSDIDYSDWSYDTSRLPKAFNVRVDDARDIQMFQVTLRSSGEPDEFFGIISMDISYQYLSEVR